MPSAPFNLSAHHGADDWTVTVDAFAIPVAALVVKFSVRSAFAYRLLL
jgi:hypothetical protein